MLLTVLLVGLAACVVGGALTRGLEKLGHVGILFMPAVGYGIGAVLRTSAGHSFAMLGPLAVLSAFVAAMLTHVPSSYSMFRNEFGGPPVRSLLLSLTESWKYPIEAAKGYPLYGLMLLLSIAAAGWKAAS